jgi:ABC-type antimicrobial peptide transport system permease subunit
LTAFAIVLGVATVSGTYVLTDSIDQAFDSIFQDVRKGSNVVITGKSPFDLSEGSGATAPAFDESLLEQVRELPDVAEAEGSVDGEAQLIGANGKAIVYGGAPNLGFSIARGDSPFNPLSLVEGAWPRTNEVVIDRSTADKEDIRVGEDVGVQAEGPVQRLHVSGLVKFGSVATIGGATLAGFDLPTAQRLFRKEGKLDEIAVAAEPGVSDEKLLASIRPILPEGTQVRSSAAQAREDAKETDQFISFLQTFLLAFGGVALFVGSFVIANSLSITIAQRTREFATLRTLGASRRQVLRSIVVEALVIGVAASVIGLFAGLLLAKGLFSLFDAVGFTLPNSGLTLRTRTIVVSLAVGILVTLLASLRPAVRATRVPPIAAVRALPRPGLAAARRPRVRRAALGTVQAGSRNGAGPAVPARRRAPDLLRRRAPLGAARASARGCARVAREDDRRCGRRAGARQLAAQSAAHGLDGGGANDRARTRDARRRARGRNRHELQGSGGRSLEERRLRHHGAEQLLADPDHGRRDRREDPRRRRRRQRAGRRDACVRQEDADHGR